jgi:hypothetical protein
VPRDGDDAQLALTGRKNDFTTRSGNLGEQDALAYLRPGTAHEIGLLNNLLIFFQIMLADLFNPSILVLQSKGGVIMIKSNIRLFVEKGAIHQIRRVSEYVTIIVGVRRVSGTRHEPTIALYTDMVIQQPNGYCNRFGIQSVLLEGRLPDHLLEDSQLNASINQLVIAGLIANHEHASKMLHLTCEDTLEKALQLTYPQS